jgi:hypothetical protein
MKSVSESVKIVDATGETRSFSIGDLFLVDRRYDQLPIVVAMVCAIRAPQISFLCITTASRLHRVGINENRTLDLWVEGEQISTISPEYLKNLIKSFGYYNIITRDKRKYVARTTSYSSRTIKGSVFLPLNIRLSDLKDWPIQALLRWAGDHMDVPDGLIKSLPRTSTTQQITEWVKLSIMKRRLVNKDRISPDMPSVPRPAPDPASSQRIITGSNGVGEIVIGGSIRTGNVGDVNWVRLFRDEISHEWPPEIHAYPRPDFPLISINDFTFIAVDYLLRFAVVPDSVIYGDHARDMYIHHDDDSNSFYKVVRISDNLDMLTLVLSEMRHQIDRHQENRADEFSRSVFISKMQFMHVPPSEMRDLERQFYFVFDERRDAYIGFPREEPADRVEEVPIAEQRGQEQEPPEGVFSYEIDRDNFADYD